MNSTWYQQESLRFRITTNSTSNVTLIMSKNVFNFASLLLYAQCICCLPFYRITTHRIIFPPPRVYPCACTLCRTFSLAESPSQSF